MALYKKYRPTTLAAVAGNGKTVEGVQSVLSKPANERPRAYLFSGGSGCGKTTVGRILASELGCNMEFDYHEYDTADFRGIDSMRDIRRNMNLRPLQGPCKVYLLDECHQISKDGQNALLKALEDTPDHVYFILCTTDPQRLIDTIRSRCTLFAMSPLSEDDMLMHLKKTVRRERKVVKDDVLERICKASNGHPRAAMVMLDKIIDLPEDKMEENIIQEKKAEDNIVDIYVSILKKESWRAIARKLDAVLATEDPEQMRRALMTMASNSLLRGKVDYDALEFLRALQVPTYDGGKAWLVKCIFEAYNGVLQD